MEGMHFISCVRFSMQLIMAEAFFERAWKRKKNFPIRIIFGIAGYFFAAWLAFQLFTSIPGSNPVVYTIYYISLFCLSLVLMWGIFQVSKKEILFAGVCGYASQHIGFAVSMIFQELTGLEFGNLGDFIFIRFLPYLLVDLLVYFILIKRYEGKSELKDRDIRMEMVALVILLTSKKKD